MAHADNVVCYTPAETWEQDGDTFSDGVIPKAIVKVNESAGGECGSGYYDGNVYDQYVFVASVENQNESDVWQEDRAWVCGKPTIDYTRDASYDTSYTTAWWNYGKWNGGECDIQFDQTVRITAWSGQRWSQYTSDQSDWGSCDMDESSRCPVGG